jgi:hypothetical protein
VLLGAHFYRAAAWPLVLACLVLLSLLAWRRPWVPRLMQAAMLLGALQWLWTAFWLVQQRLSLNSPWQRMAFILLAVALGTAAGALVFRHAKVRRWFAAR